jgi:hypothetical protein
MLSRVSCARAASESTADDVFIFPKQWKYRIIPLGSQMDKTRLQHLDETSSRTSNVFIGPGKRPWASVRLALGFLQMFGAVFSVTLLFQTGVTAHTLLAVAITGVLTTVSILLFGARRSERGLRGAEAPAVTFVTTEVVLRGGRPRLGRVEHAGQANRFGWPSESTPSQS